MKSVAGPAKRFSTKQNHYHVDGLKSDCLYRFRVRAVARKHATDSKGIGCDYGAKNFIDLRSERG